MVGNTKSVTGGQRHSGQPCLKHQADKDIGEDDEALANTDESSTDNEESFVQTRRNINDNNAEAAEMVRLEDQSDKDMCEDDLASAE